VAILANGTGIANDRLRSDSHEPLTVMLPISPPDPMLEHAIRLRAYEHYLQRGMTDGYAIDDWLKAEAEIVHGHSTSNSNMP